MKQTNIKINERIICQVVIGLRRKIKKGDVIVMGEEVLFQSGTTYLKIENKSLRGKEHGREKRASTKALNTVCVQEMAKPMWLEQTVQDKNGKALPQRE